MDTLITIAIFIGISLVSAWLKKKQEEKEAPDTFADDQPEPPHRSAPPPVSRPATSPSPRQVSWEDELRRLLEGEQSAPPPAPPPVIEEPIREPLPPPPVPRPVRIPPPVPVRPIVFEPEVVRPVAIPTFLESAQGQERARQIKDRVGEQMRQAIAQVSTHHRVSAVKVQSPEVLTARSMLRNRDQVRSAFIASIILGPPKALEENA